MMNSGREKEAEGGREKGAEGGREKGAEGGRKKGAEGGRKVGVEIGRKKGAEGAREKGPEGGREKGAEGGREKGELSSDLKHCTFLVPHTACRTLTLPLRLPITPSPSQPIFSNNIITSNFFTSLTTPRTTLQSFIISRFLVYYRSTFNLDQPL